VSKKQKNIFVGPFVTAKWQLANHADPCLYLLSLLQSLLSC